MCVGRNPCCCLGGPPERSHEQRTGKDERHSSPDAAKPSLQPEQDDRLSVRFAPAGLMASECFRSSGRLSCVTCHDPHDNAKRDDSFYTARCISCHAATKGTIVACERASGQNCIPCHMERTRPAPELKFTDHRIRVLNDPAHEVAGVKGLRPSGTGT